VKSKNEIVFLKKSEFFMDAEGVWHRRQSGKQHQIVVPQTLVQQVISMNHDPMFVANPGRKRTYDLISLRYWWPKMRQTIDDYVMGCDPCQRRKDGREYRAPLGEVEEPSEPFEITSMDIMGPYPLTPRKNEYLLTFIDHFSKHVEAYSIPDQTAETCARVYATQIITKNGCGTTLITDQGRSFVSSFFKETCKILKVKKVQTSPYHPCSNLVERFHKSLHDGLSHYIASAGTNWDQVVPFYLMTYRAIPHCTTKYSPFYLLHDREMKLPKPQDLKPKLSQDVQNPDQVQRLEDLKSSKAKTYEVVKHNIRKSHQMNKCWYDRKAKDRQFQVGDLVYLFSPARKPGKCKILENLG
jgi:hypothetical protein